MGQQFGHGERILRSPALRPARPHAPARPHGAADGATPARLSRYALRALLVAGAAGTLWFLGSQAASAEPVGADQPSSHSVGAVADQQCDAGPLAGTTHAVEAVTDVLTRPGSDAARQNRPGHDTAGQQTCGRQPAGTHGGTIRPRSAQVANSTRASRQDAPNAPRAGHSRIVPLKGTTFRIIGALEPLDPKATDPANFPVRSADAGKSGRAPHGHSAEVTRPVVGHVARTAGQVTGPRTMVLREVVRGLRQSPVTDVPTTSLRHGTTALVHGATPIVRSCTGPLVDATRPVVGKLRAVVHPLPGVSDTVRHPLTGVLTGRHGDTPGSFVPTGPGAPFQASAEPGTHRQEKPLAKSSSQARRAPVRGSNLDPFATWTVQSRVDSTDRNTDTGHPAPVMPGPTPIPAYPGSGVSNGGMGTSSAAHADGGLSTCAASSPVHAGSASRVQPRTTEVGLPRLCENDPVVSPD